MPALPVRDIAGTASAKASSGWHTCMSKKYCKYPAIIALLLAIALALLALYCLFRFLSCCCCDCLSGGRYQRAKSRKHNRHADLHSSPYMGYQQQSARVYNGPPQHARFENDRGGGERGDELPKMPVWEDAEEKKRVYDLGGGAHGAGVGGAVGEMGVRAKAEKEKELEYERLPMLARERDPAPRYEEVRMDASSGGDLGQRGGYKPYSARAKQGQGQGDM